MHCIKVLREDLVQQKSKYEDQIDQLKAQLESREMELQRAVELLVNHFTLPTIHISGLHRSELAAQLGASNSLANTRS